MAKDYIPFDWKNLEDKTTWLEPCEESYYYAEKWKREGRRSVLDLGCGLGRHSILFAKYGFKVTAMDCSAEALDFLKKCRCEQNLNFTCKRADMKAMPFSADAFDCIFAMHSAGHADTAAMEKIISEIKRVLKPEGTIFLTLCSKETWTYAESGLPKLDANTVVKTEGVEKGVPHFFIDTEDIKKLFADFELVKVRHIDECYTNRKWKNEKHYFIEAVLHKEAAKLDFSGIIGQHVNCKIDRPLGSFHPRAKDLYYPINYGYVEGVFAGDGAEQDVYILGVDKPLETFSGKVIAVYHRFNDVEDKWIVAPEDSDTAQDSRFSREEILKQINFQEKFFDGELYL